jgi:hypothetical protein
MRENTFNIHETHLEARYLSKCGKHLLHLGLGDVLVQVLYEAVCEPLCLLAQLNLPLLAWHEAAHKDLLSVKQHTVDLKQESEKSERDLWDGGHRRAQRVGSSPC